MLPRLALALLFASFAAAQALADPNPAPTQLMVSVIQGQVQLTWLPPEAGSGNTQVRLLRRLNAPPSGPNDGVADVIYAGEGTQYVHPTTELLPHSVGSPHVYHYAAFGCDAAGTTCESSGSTVSLAPSLITVLRGGGYTLWWRHASATVCGDLFELGTARNTTVPNWWKSCDANCPGGGAWRASSTTPESWRPSRSVKPSTRSAFPLVA